MSAKPNEKAVFGSACRDMLAQLELPKAMSGAEGESGGQAGRPLTRRELDHISPVDFPFLVERIRRLLSRLEMRSSRRQKPVHRSSWIDVKRSARRSFRFGGAMFALGFKRLRLRQPHVVILCDVSASMIRHVRFMLPLMFAMSRLAKDTRVFVCAGGLEEVTDLFRQNNDFQQATDWLLQQTTQVGRGTNLGQAFSALRSEVPRVLSSSTCLLVVSDAETVGPDLAVQEVRHIAGRIKKLVWLNTQPRRQWHENKIIPSLRRYTRMEECTTLARTVKILQSL